MKGCRVARPSSAVSDEGLRCHLAHVAASWHALFLVGMNWFQIMACFIFFHVMIHQ
jgi:hypothetical protein